jgi:hypothetical protein
MNPRSTWLWLIVAAGLFAFIWFYQRPTHKPLPGPQPILADFAATNITGVEVSHAEPGAFEIQAVRTNGSWELLKPVVYPAQSLAVESLLRVLERMMPATYFSAADIRSRPRGDDEYGFASPQISVKLEQAGNRARLLFGAKTAPGDQVYVQRVGTEGVFVVDAGVLKLIPPNPTEWREAVVFDPATTAFDHIAITNGRSVCELRRGASTRLWRLTSPFPARADNARMEDLLQKLGAARIRSFVSDAPNPDLEPLGLQPPQLEIGFSQGTSNVCVLQVGKAVTNDPAQVYARRQGQANIFTVSSNLFTAWRAPVNEFRDPHLLALTQPVDTIEVGGEATFALERGTNDTWRIMPQNLAADTGLVQDLLAQLAGMQIVQFVQDVVADPGLAPYGLATPAREYTLRSAATNDPAGGTNGLLVRLEFGTNAEDKVFARRPDETAVVAVKLADFKALPAAPWQFRERQLWDVAITNVARVTIKQQGRSRVILRKGDHEWSLAPGSQGVVEELGVEETVKGLCHPVANSWIARGESNRAQYGISDKSHVVTLEMRSGEQMTVEFGGVTPSTAQYAGVTLGGEYYLFEFPWPLYRDVAAYLNAP